MGPRLRRIIVGFYLLLLVSSLACGGGGGDSKSSFAGTWFVSARLQSNGCNIDIAALGIGTVIEPGYTINQDGTNIAARNISTDFTLSGTTVDDGKGFIATSSQSIAQCNLGFFTSSLIFANKSGDHADAAYNIQGTCDNAPPCETTWVGTAERA